MKAITVKQPWASLICDGIKDVENRTWKTKFRGRVLIHASSQYDKRHRDMSLLFTSEQWKYMYEKKGNFLLNRCLFLSFPLSQIIGSVEIVDCVINHDSIWAEKSVLIEKPKKSDFLIDGNFVQMDWIGYNMALSKWKMKKPVCNWVLSNPILFDKPIPAKGKLSLWDYEFDENAYECTNDNPVSHQSCGERRGCIQDCGACDYFELKSEYE